MALKLEDKKLIVAELSDVASCAIAAGAAEYRGLSVAEMSSLRDKARKMGIYLKIVRNTLARRALENSEFACMLDVLSGPIFLAFAKEEPGAVARLLKEAAGSNDKLQVRALALGGKLYPAGALSAIADLPSREQALAGLMSVMKAAITKLVRTMAEPYAQLTRAVAAVAEAKR